MLARHAVAALVAATALALPASASADASRWIVVLQDGADSAQTARDHRRAHGAEISHVYRAALRGYAATIPDARIAAVRADPRVDFVEPDLQAHALAQTIPYGIDKVDADVSSTKAGDGTGAVSNVNAYVIDTGIADHADLNRVGHVNFAGGKNGDCNGHGTHVAGTVAAEDNAQDVVGVAPGAPLTGVKVLGCSGSGSYSNVIKGVDWVTANASKPAVANMSLGGPPSDALDKAVRNSAASGVFYALAAGNDGADACGSSPARAGAGTDNGIATVAATDENDLEASFSNFGSCVDIWAPGVRVESTSHRGGTVVYSGTSMASPHVAGGGALYLSGQTSAGSSTTESALTSSAFATGTLSKDGAPVSRLHVGGF